MKRAHWSRIAANNSKMLDDQWHYRAGNPERTVAIVQRVGGEYCAVVTMPDGSTRKFPLHSIGVVDILHAMDTTQELMACLGWDNDKGYEV